jgi:hypothetical protein
MNECGSLPTCVFFNEKMINMPANAEIMKDNYCRSKYEDCARYIVMKAIGKEKVPPDLFPSDRARAEQLVRPLGRN